MRTIQTGLEVQENCESLSGVTDAGLDLKSTVHSPHIFSTHFAPHTVSSLPCDKLEQLQVREHLFSLLSITQSCVPHAPGALCPTDCAPALSMAATSTSFSLGFPASCPAATSAVLMFCQLPKSTTCAAQSQLPTLCVKQRLCTCSQRHTGGWQQAEACFPAAMLVRPRLTQPETLHQRTPI